MLKLPLHRLTILLVVLLASWRHISGETSNDYSDFYEGYFWSEDVDVIYADDVTYEYTGRFICLKINMNQENYTILTICSIGIRIF